MMLNGYYFGMISDVYPPGSTSSPRVANTSPVAPYKVMVIGEGYATLPVYCVREDRFGSRDAFEDIIS